MARKIDNRQSKNRPAMEADVSQLGPQTEVLVVKGEISLSDLDAVSGGGSRSIGSQSTGSGAGKVAFDPF